MKGGLAALWGALALLRAERGAPTARPDDWGLVVVPDEEIGGPVTPATMRH